MADKRTSNIAIAFAIAVLLALAYVLRSALVIIYVSIIFAVIFSPIVGRISRLHVGRWSPGKGISILILIGGLLLAVGLFVALAAPPIARDAKGLSSDLPAQVGQLQQKVRSLPFGHSIADKVNVTSIEKYLGDAIQSVFTFFQSVAGGLTALITLVLLIAYFILDGRRAFEWAMSLIPSEERDRLARTLIRGGDRIQKWLGGQLLLMLILGASSAVVLGLLGIRYFYAIAVLAGMANFVPILGPLATVLVAGVVAALDSWTKLLGVVIFYAIYQQVENSFLTPKIMKATVDLPAVAVIIALLIGGELAGLLGAIVAVPTAALISTLIAEYLVQPDTKQEDQKNVLKRVS